MALRGVPVPIQPRVFDLLVHLVRNAGRVIPKDELMDALWPDVIVTEASLQRLVSLARRALEPGGLHGAIRSFVRHGYRFSVDRPDLALARSESAIDGLADALRLMQQHDWLAATQTFEKLDAAGELAAEDIDRWALAVECLGRPAAVIPVLIQAVAAHVREGNPHLAARDAVTLAKIEVERSAAAAAAGWLDRAEMLKEGIDDPRTDAYFLWMKSRMASFSGRCDEALALAEQAHRAAIACDDAGLIALALTYRGFYKISLVGTEEGAGEQNHAAAIALSSGVDPITGSSVYCNILWSCRTLPDWTRAMQWSLGFDAWCQENFAEIPGNCDLHRAEVLGAQRDLTDALRSIDSAIGKLADEEAWSIGDGYRVRGDIKAMIGDLDGARADYAAAYAVGWDAEPGNAMLLAETGNVEAALLALDRALSGLTWYHVQRRGILLAHRARIAAFGGHFDVAFRTLEEIESMPARGSHPAALALVSEAHYHLERHQGAGAIRHLMLARQLWTRAGTEYHAARLRIELAEALLRTGDAAGAQAELSAAERTGNRIRSHRLCAAVAALAPIPRALPAPVASAEE